MITGILPSLPGTGVPARSGEARDFMQLLLKELTTQNPLDPVDQGELISQITGLRLLEETASMGQSFRELGGVLGLSSASGLLGRTVQATTPDGRLVAGAVTSVLLDEGKVRISLAGETVPVEWITRVE